MSLYVRVLNNFYTHRKTIRLHALIGDAAFWVPPRLWAYAATNQPDGCFKDYSAEEIALFIGYHGDAKVMLQALLQACFMDSDPLRIHDWQDHNGYHVTFSKRAKKAAKARWANNPSPHPSEKTVQDKIRQEGSIASSIAKQCLKHPSVEELKLLFAKIGLPESEASRFFDFYESNGWRVGKNPMKNWRSAAQNWKRNYDERRYQNNGKVAPTQRPMSSEEYRALEQKRWAEENQP